MGICRSSRLIRTALVSCAAAAAATGAAVATVVDSGPASANPAGVTTNVNLVPQPVGHVTLKVSSTGRVVATLDATGFAPGTPHAIDIQSGGCDVAGTPMFNFPDVTASGTGQVMTTVTSDSRLQGSEFVSGAFVVHLGAGASMPVAGLPIACVPVGTLAGGHTLALRSESDQVGTLQGHASVVYQPAKKTLTVHVQASGLAPFSQHAAHVHQGSCASQGPVLYMLPDLVANAEGQVNEVATFTNVPNGPPPTGWYLNLHLGASSQIATSAGVPTILFRPLLCGDIHGS